MRLSDLHEMAVRGGDLTAMADEWAAKMQARISSSESKKKIGSIDGMDVIKWNMLVSVWYGDSMVAVASVDDIAGEYCIVDDVWIEPSMRNRKLFVKLLAFIKNEMKFNRIMLGRVHSDSTYNLLKNGGLTAFKKTWVHLQSNENKPFDKDTIDDFYQDSKWALFLENTEDWSQFVREDSFTHSYEALAHAIGQHASLA